MPSNTEDNFGDQGSILPGKNKMDPLLALVWNRKGLHEAHTERSFDQLDLPHQRVEGNISLDFTPCLKAKQFAFENLITSIFPPNPLTA